MQIHEKISPHTFQTIQLFSRKLLQLVAEIEKNKNFTTDVPVTKIINDVQELIVQMGVTNFSEVISIDDENDDSKTILLKLHAQLAAALLAIVSE